MKTGFLFFFFFTFISGTKAHRDWTGGKLDLPQGELKNYIRVFFFFNKFTITSAQLFCVMWPN